MHYEKKFIKNFEHPQAKLFYEATKTCPHFSLPKVICNTGPKQQWSTQKASSMS